MTKYHHNLLVALMLAGNFMTGCSTTHYHKSADEEVYDVIAEKTPGVPGMVPDMTIDKPDPLSLEGQPMVSGPREYLGEAAQSEVGAYIISLEKALDIAFTHSRTYQNRKESAYLQALSLTLDRHDFAPIFSGGFGADYARSTTDVEKLSDFGRTVDFLKQVETLTGTPAKLLKDYSDLVESVEGLGETVGLAQTRTEIMNERSVGGSTGVGLDLLMKGGGRFAIDLTSNFLRFLTGDPRVSTSSALVASFSQPLLRGAGRRIAAENLTQAERDLLYSLRDFTRFRKEFAVQIASDYYGVLQNRDEVRNNWLGYQAFRRAVERERRLAEEGRVTQIDLGRQLQAEFGTESEWVRSIRSYKQDLDNFKILLGLSTDAPIVLDGSELDRLLERGIRHPNISSEDAVEVALVTRLDLYTARDQWDDGGRKVEVAANSLKPDLDLVLAAAVNSKPGDRFQELDFQRGGWSAGLDVDLPLDRKAERNAYRAAVIAYERAARDLELAEDEVKLNVRNAWRNLEEAKRNYEISLGQVELNERRVAEQNMRAELGRATAIDTVDAQNDLIDSLNRRTGYLIGHTIALLRFWRDMGILYIKENGQWEDVSDVK